VAGFDAEEVQRFLASGMLPDTRSCAGVMGAWSSGILLVDKAGGMTSHDVVSRARRMLGTRKVGHAGTLDPMATGLLILGVNSSTRLLTYLVGLDKEYLATIRLGLATTTDDAEGELLGEPVDATHLTDAEIAAAILQLTGEISQRPSTVSAIKVDGKRAYALAREGVEVELRERAVTVAAFELLDVRRDDAPFVDLDARVECSSGTYIRALARDLGASLGVGGHLTALRRTRIGPFGIADARPIDHDPVLIRPQDAASRLFPAIPLDSRQAADLANGKRVTLPAADSDGPVAALDPAGELVGLIAIVGGRARVLANFPSDRPSEAGAP
jgi:tRNA pseudouridine55 synthase